MIGNRKAKALGWTTLSLVSIAGVAAAQDPPRLAEKLFQEGVAAVKAHDYALADEKFRAAFKLNPTYDPALNLGLVDCELGKYRDCAEYLSYALEHWTLRKKDQIERPIADKKLAEARSHVGSLKLTVDREGAAVLVDGNRVGVAPVPELFLEPGSHEISAIQPGFLRAARAVDAKAGVTETVTLTLAPEPGSGAPAQSSAPAASAKPVSVPRSKAPVLILGAIAAAGIGVGIAGVVASANNASTRDARSKALDARGASACRAVPTPVACSDYDDAAKNVGSFRNLAIAGFAIGAATGVGAAVIWLSGHDAKRPAGVSVGPGGVVVRGRF